MPAFLHAQTYSRLIINGQGGIVDIVGVIAGINGVDTLADARRPGVSKRAIWPLMRHFHSAPE
jgi:hypothetical protein